MVYALYVAVLKLMQSWKKFKQISLQDQGKEHSSVSHQPLYLQTQQ